MMHPLVHSTSYNNFKSKWNNFKTWIIPDLNKRRPSQCSTTSTTSSTSCGCSTPEPQSNYMKRPSISYGSDGIKVVSPFRKKSVQLKSILDIDTEIQKLDDLYHLALDELNYAQDSIGSPYYLGDKLAAQEAIANMENSFNQLSSSDFIDHHFNSKLSSLKQKYKNLPIQEDQFSL